MRFSVLSIFFILFFNPSAFSNKIDDLLTDKDVNEFIKSINPEFTKDENGKFQIQATDTILERFACNGVFATWNIRNWEKADITNDGLTDLVFVAYWYDYISYACIDKGNNNFELIRFSKNPSGNCAAVKPVRIGERSYLKLFQKTQQPDGSSKMPFSYKEVVATDTLIFKYNSFIEFGTAADDVIESIEINVSGCFGTCPSFNLKLYKDGKGDFQGLGYTKSKGKSSKVLSKQIFKELSALVNDINVRKLNNDYYVPWTDDQTATLTIIFNDGSKKTIRDYGKQGTFGLSAIYSKMISVGIGW